MPAAKGSARTPLGPKWVYNYMLYYIYSIKLLMPFSRKMECFSKNITITPLKWNVFWHPVCLLGILCVAKIFTLFYFISYTSCRYTIIFYEIVVGNIIRRGLLILQNIDHNAILILAWGSTKRLLVTFVCKHYSD
jgi:hypothetical protein